MATTKTGPKKLLKRKPTATKTTGSTAAKKAARPKTTKTTPAKAKAPAKKAAAKKPAAKATPKAAPKKGAAKPKATANGNGRHPGRRKAADGKVAERHFDTILKAEAKRRELEEKAKQATTDLAEKIDKAMQAGVQTNLIAEKLGVSRQMVYKLVRERVDGKPLASKAKPKATKAASKPKAKRSAKKS